MIRVAGSGNPFQDLRDLRRMCCTTSRYRDILWHGDPGRTARRHFGVKVPFFLLAQDSRVSGLVARLFRVNMSIARRNSGAAKVWATKRRESQEKALRRDQTSTISRRATKPDSPEVETTARRAGSPGLAEYKPHPYFASTSHEANAAYMEDFRAGMANMYRSLEQPSDTQADTHDRDKVTPRCSRLGDPPAAASTAVTNGPMVRGHKKLDGLWNTRALDRMKKPVSAESRECAGAVARSGRILLADEVKKDSLHSVGVASGWYRGPIDPAGQLVDLSDRNLLCMSVRCDEAVFGCADHALYGISLSQGVKTKQLYGSRSNPGAGHKEWITTVAHTAQGDIVSGGMDGRLCLWPGQGGDPGEIQAHAGSISLVKADGEGRIVSCGYGGALRVWDCRSSRRMPQLTGELCDVRLPAPCMDFAWNGANVVTGHRDGRLGLFDLETGTMVVCIRDAHRGHVTTVSNLAPSPGRGGGDRPGCCFVTGGQDGFVRIWDARVGGKGGGKSSTGGEGGGMEYVMEAPAHRGPKGVGAVGGVIMAGEGGNRLASFGADRRVCILETRGGRGVGLDSGKEGGGGGRRSGSRGAHDRMESSALAIEHVFDEHRDFIYCMDFVPASTSRGMSGERDIFGSNAVGGEEGGGGVLVTGGGDGMLLVHDLGSMRLSYGLGCCSAGAVRCVVAQKDRLTVGGDDGNAMLYNFEGDARGRGYGGSEEEKSG